MSTAPATSNSRSRLVWTSSAPDYGVGDIVWAHCQGDFPGKGRPLLVIGRHGPVLRACAFYTGRHRSSFLVEATAANGLHHESWLSFEDRQLHVGAVAWKLGTLEPAVLAKALLRLAGAPPPPKLGARHRAGRARRRR